MKFWAVSQLTMFEIQKHWHNTLWSLEELQKLFRKQTSVVKSQWKPKEKVGNLQKLTTWFDFLTYFSFPMLRLFQFIHHKRN